MVILLELEPGGKACNEDLVSALLLADMLFSYMQSPGQAPQSIGQGTAFPFSSRCQVVFKTSIPGLNASQITSGQTHIRSLKSSSLEDHRQRAGGVAGGGRTGPLSIHAW